MRSGSSRDTVPHLGRGAAFAKDDDMTSSSDHRAWPVPRRLDRVDRRIAFTLRHFGVRALRYAIAFVFVLFGILKPLGISPAEELLRSTIGWVPLVSTDFMLHAIGWWEVAIGVCFAWRPLLRVGIALLGGQMVGTFLPLLVVPGACYERAELFNGWTVWTLTTEAQYILKNLLIIAGAMVVGGTARRPGRRGHRQTALL
jgi:hypothetical protein